MPTLRLKLTSFGILFVVPVGRAGRSVRAAVFDGAGRGKVGADFLHVRDRSTVMPKRELTGRVFVVSILFICVLYSNSFAEFVTNPSI